MSDDGFDVPDEPCKFCGSRDTFIFPTLYALFRQCRSCGERIEIRPSQPPMVIRDISENHIGDPFKAALNELSKEQYANEDERIHEAQLGGGA
jgi:hypothetical protein